LFDKTIDTGIKHGTVTVVEEGKCFEVTTFRIDGRYLDHRRPEQVEYTSSLEKDLGRRDLTINAVAYHPAQGFIDPFNGIADLQSCIIRTVGDADKRFEEDALRMLRAIRFSAQLDFRIHNDVLKSIENKKALIKNISVERIRDELTKILISPAPSKFILLYDTGLFELIFSELDICFNCRHEIMDKIFHKESSQIFDIIEKLENSSIVRWAVFLYEVVGQVIDYEKRTAIVNKTENSDIYSDYLGKVTSSSYAVLKHLKFDKRSMDKICNIMKYYNIDIRPEPKSVRKAVSIMGGELFEELIKIREAYNFTDEIRQIRDIYDNSREKGECMNLKDLAVNGEDLLEIGFEEGKKIGDVLNILLDAAIQNPEINSKSQLLSMAQKLML